MNSSYLNMAAGSFLGTVFVVMSISLVSDALFHTEAPEEPGFVIEVAESTEGGGAPAEEAGTPIAQLLQNADAAAGQESFRKCAACHTIEEGGPNGVGPNLWDVVNRPIASVDGFSYSTAMQEFSEGGEKVWDYEHLAGFLADPRGYVSGTAMGFAGLSREEELANVIAYLREQSNEPAPLPEVEAAPEGEAAAEGEGGEEAAAEGGGGGEGGDSDMGPAVALMAQADPANGESIFRRCQACHSIEEGGPNRVGPNLWSVVERPVASVEGFNYSTAMQDYSQGGDVAWSLNRLDSFLLAPQEEVDGTSMGFAGLPNDEDRADLLAYLNSMSNEPVAIPGAGEEEAAADGEASGEDAAATGEEPQQAAEEPTEEPAGETAPAEDAAEDASTASPDGEEATQETAPAGSDAAAETEAATEAETGEEPATNEDAAAAEEQETATAEAPASGEGETAAGGETEGAVALLAEADPANGQQIFAACSACHSVEQGGPTLVGPNLWGVVNRDVASVDGFQYTENMQTYGGENAVWDYALLDQFLEAPMEEVPGTMMAFPGVKDTADRADVIAYLRSLAEEPAPLPGQ